MRPTVTTTSTLHDVPAPDWDALAGEHDPFVEHGFLVALEDGGCVGPDTAWIPRYLLLKEGDRLVGAAPLYVKLDSYGEYIFDWGWAEGARRAGLRYYPKLTLAVPFTPATGPRVLHAPDRDPADIAAILGQAAVDLAERGGASGVHWLFCTPTQADLLARVPGCTHRLTHQFHWEQRGWQAFDDYLAAMTPKRRKEVRRERRQVAALGLDVRVVEGPALTAGDWDALWRFYCDTTGKMGAIRYLTRAFFDRIAATFAHRVVAVLAYREGEPVAGTLNFRKGRHLYGRYWGAVEDHRALHFECCYYQLIDYAIGHGVTRFEAGAQGEHKLQRGLLPTLTHSVHHLRHPGLSAAVEQAIAIENERQRRYVEALRAHSPFSADR